MQAKTHIAFAFLIALLTYSYFNINTYLFFSLVIIGALFPDIDIPSSKIGRRSFGLSHIIKIFFSHRGIFHSLIMLVFIPGLIFYFLDPVAGIAFFIGYLSHLIADALTKKGISLLHPLPGIKISGFVNTGSVIETIILAIIILEIFILII